MRWWRSHGNLCYYMLFSAIATIASMLLFMMLWCRTCMVLRKADNSATFSLRLARWSSEITGINPSICYWCQSGTDGLAVVLAGVGWVEVKCTWVHFLAQCSHSSQVWWKGSLRRHFFQKNVIPPPGLVPSGSVMVTESLLSMSSLAGWCSCQRHWWVWPLQGNYLVTADILRGTKIGAVKWS